MGMTPKAARVNAGLTQAFAAESLNISRSSLQNYENYRSVPSVTLAKKMARLYKLSVDDIEFTK